MVKCPFCGFSNEDGALFCEQCKSDLSAVAPAPPPPPPMPQEVPVADIIEATPMGEVPPAEVIPSAAVVEAPPFVPEPLPEPLPAMAPPLEQEAAAAAAVAPAPPPAAPGAAPGKGAIPAGAAPKLVVMRGQKVGMEFPVYPGENYIGRSDEKP